MTLPDQLSAALSSHRSRIGDSENRPTGREIVQRGDIRQVEPCFDDPHDAVRLALVLTVDPDGESVEIVLVHPYVELATETDLVFTPDETRAPYPIVVQTRVRSAVWTLQMGKRVGSLSEEDLEEFSRVAVDDNPFTVSPRTGLPLAGPADYRWNFKLQEIETLNHLAADRIFTALEGSLHPQWLPPSSSQDPSELDMDELEALFEADAFNPDPQANQFGRDLARDFCNSYQSSCDRILANAA